MRLIIKQRVFSWTDSYDVLDESGKAKYFVKAEWLSFGHQLHVYDRFKTEIGVIRQKIFVFTPTFDIEIGGITKGRIKKQFTLFSQKYDVEFNGWRVEGDFLGWDYDVYSGSLPIFHIRKELLHWGDTYVIDIENPGDEVLALMLVIAIDAANCSRND